MWWPATQPWQYRVLDAMPASIDLGQLEHALTMSPTERVEAMLAMVKLGEALRRARRP